MSVLTKEHLDNLKSKLEIQFPNGRVEYIGCNRFIVVIKNQVEFEGRYDFIDKYFLFDSDLQEIIEAREFDTIYMCTKGIITVSKNSLPTFSGTKKFGLIDINGKELLPCEYDRASPKLDGLVELRREGLEFFVPIKEIVEGEYVWENYRDDYSN
jgi:hypothetical protein